MFNLGNRLVQAFLQAFRQKGTVITLFFLIIMGIIALFWCIKPISMIPSIPTSEVVSISGVDVISHNFDRDASGLCYIIGEVRNTSPDNLIVEIVAFLYRKGSVVGFGWGFTFIPILVPNQKSPFRIVLKPTQENIEHYMLKLKFGTTVQQPYRGLRVLTHFFYIDDLGHFHVIGKIKNEGDQDVGRVEVIGTFYDVTGAVITINSIHIDLQNLTAGQAVWFELVIPDEALSYKISDYSLDTWSPFGLHLVSPKW